MSTPDFAPYCEQACRQYWGDPTSEKPRILRWAVGDYLWRSYDRKKCCWYDSEAGRGGGTLQLAALALGLSADSKIEGETFFRCWRYAAEHWGVEPPPTPPEQDAKADTKADTKAKPSKKRNGAAKPWSPIVARYVYRQADGTPYLQVCRTAAKTFFQNHWNGQMWVPNKPEGPPILFMLPEVLAAPLTTPVHITEGEKDSTALAKLGFVATTNSEGALAWTDDLNEHFRDRVVFIHEDNDDDGRKRCQRIARALDPIAKSVRIIRLPGLPRCLGLARRRSVGCAAGQALQEHAAMGAIDGAAGERDGHRRQGQRSDRRSASEEEAGRHLDRARVIGRTISRSR
jgi:hypothetical protein